MHLESQSWGHCNTNKQPFWVVSFQLCFTRSPTKQQERISSLMCKCNNCWIFIAKQLRNGDYKTRPSPAQNLDIKAKKKKPNHSLRLSFFLFTLFNLNRGLTLCRLRFHFLLYSSTFSPSPPPKCEHLSLFVFSLVWPWRAWIPQPPTSPPQETAVAARARLILTTFVKDPT